MPFTVLSALFLILPDSSRLFPLTKNHFGQHDHTIEVSLILDYTKNHFGHDHTIEVSDLFWFYVSLITMHSFLLPISTFMFFLHFFFLHCLSMAWLTWFWDMKKNCFLNKLFKSLLRKGWWYTGPFHAPCKKKKKILKMTI